MKIMSIAVVLLVIGLAALAIYVRLTPVTPKPVSLDYSKDTAMTGGFVAVRAFDGDAAAVLERLTQVALMTPRTTLVSQEPLTFVTRSRGFGFPDVTQVWVRDGTLTVHAHLVYGKADLGVNKARVLAWLEALGPL